MDKSHKDTIRKIRKLMRMAERGGTLEEAQNALERIREIMARYNLSMQDVEKFREEDCAEEFVRISTKYVPGYIKLLVNAMNLLFQCESAFISDRIKNCHNITFIGVGADPLIASQTFVFLLEFARRKLKERKISIKEKEDYLFGFARAILARAIQIYEKAMQAPQEYGLVPVKDAAIKDYIRKHYSKARNLPNARMRDASKGLYAGLEDGRKASLNRPVETAQKAELAGA